MKQLYYKLKANLTGKNSLSTPPEVIVDQMNEPRALPMGKEEFHVWADRIIAGALCPADVESQKFALANMLMHLGPTESHKADAFFIHSLRKFAVNQVADSIRKEIHEDAKKRLEAEELKKAAQIQTAEQVLEEGDKTSARVSNLNPNLSGAQSNFQAAKLRQEESKRVFPEQ